MINILDIPDQYFFVWDRARHEAAIDGLEIVRDIEKEDNEDKRENLNQRIIPIVGFREAAKLKHADPKGVKQALEAVIERQQYLKGYLETRIEEASQRAADKHSNAKDFGKREMRRDAVFYTLARSGLMVISNSLVGEEDWEKVSGEISNGQRLERYLPSEIIDLTRDLLPRAILFNQQRDELKSRLKEYGLDDEHLRQLDGTLPQTLSLDFPENQRSQINVMLEMCVSSETDFEREFSRLSEQLQLDCQNSRELKQKLKKVVKGSAFRLASSLSGLRTGRIPDTDILAGTYRTTKAIHLYPLGAEVGELWISEMEIDHTHTRNSRYTATMYNCLMPRNSLPTKLIKFLEIEDVSTWSKNAGISLLDPNIQFKPEYVGELIGWFLFGHSIGLSGSLGYNPKRRDQDQLFNLLEKCGKISREPSVADNPNKLGGLPERLTKIYLVPKQFLHLAEYGLRFYFENSVDNELPIAALRCWLEDRFLSESRYGSGRATLKPEYEDVIRKMACQTGLELGRSYHSINHSNKLRVRVANPEVVGYRSVIDCV